MRAMLMQRGTAFPRVLERRGRSTQRAVNEAIREAAYRAIPDYDPGTSIVEATSSYQTMLNAKSILSLRFQDYIYPELAAHGVTQVSSVTLNLGDAHVYRFDELFRPGAAYRMRLTQLVQAQIAAGQIPVLAPFPGIAAEENYYLTPDSLVIYYQPYVYTPGAYGVLEFALPYAEIADLINPRGPIGVLLAAS